MLKGADKEVRDKKGKNAMDVAMTVAGESLRNDLMRILGPPGRL